MITLAPEYLRSSAKSHLISKLFLCWKSESCKTLSHLFQDYCHISLLARKMAPIGFEPATVCLPMKLVWPQDPKSKSQKHRFEMSQLCKRLKARLASKLEKQLLFVFLERRELFLQGGVFSFSLAQVELCILFPFEDSSTTESLLWMEIIWIGARNFAWSDISHIDHFSPSRKWTKLSCSDCLRPSSS